MFMFMCVVCVWFWFVCKRVRIHACECVSVCVRACVTHRRTHTT